MRITLAGATATGKSTLAKWLAERFGFPMNPEGSRSTAGAMGFVNHEGKALPYNVDRASLAVYEAYLPEGVEVAAQKAMEAWAVEGGTTVRPLFQRKLQLAKIEWETAHESYVSDRTPLDDMAYALMHCPEVVDEAFRDRAFQHCTHYNLVVYCDLDAGQWFGAGDEARVENNPMYHWRYDRLLRGMMLGKPGLLAPRLSLQTGDLQERKDAILYALGEGSLAGEDLTSEILAEQEPHWGPP